MRPRQKRGSLHREPQDSDLQQQLHHAERLATVGQLAAGIAHELNGPLTNILGYAQLASKNEDLPEQVYSDLDNIVRLALHAREIVKKVMLFSRQMPPKREPLCLNKVVRDGLYFTEPLVARSCVETRCHLEDSLPQILGDASQLRQVLVNLVVNAVQAMPEGGIITITTARDPRGVTLRVQDTGTGMDSHTRENCFNPFFTTKDIHEGTGLGLSVAQGIVEAHDARISVRSQSGKGACFSVFFPLQATEDEE